MIYNSVSTGIVKVTTISIKNSLASSLVTHTSLQTCNFGHGMFNLYTTKGTIIILASFGYPEELSELICMSHWHTLVAYTSASWSTGTVLTAEWK